MKDIQATPTTPAVVLSKGRVSLADHLDLRNLPLATTPGGRNFSLKALHPSEHTIKSARIPGGNKMSVAICSDGVYDIPIANANTQCQIALLPNPVGIGRCTVSHGNVTDNDYNFFNAAFSGGSRPCMEDTPTNVKNQNYIDDFVSKVTDYRITSQSVTAELIAPALADQGTITAVQYSARKADGQFSDLTSTAMITYSDWACYQTPLSPGEAILGTNAYTAKAREGVYMPLKLTSLKWHSASDQCRMFERNATQMNAAYSSENFATTQLWPYYSNNTSATGIAGVPHWPKMCGNGFGTIVFAGLSAGTTLRLRFRQVVEVTARPSTAYAPLLENALPPDETALRMYFEVSARMADAYPASYNDLGKLKDIISKIGKTVLPYVEPALSLVSAMPGPIGTVAKVASTAVPVVKQVASTVKAIKAAKGKKPQPASK